MIREYITLKTLKETITGLAVLSLGAWIGINYVVQLSINNLSRAERLAGNAPEWHSTALQMGRYWLLFAGICVLGWIILDYYGGERNAN